METEIKIYPKSNYQQFLMVSETDTDLVQNATMTFCVMTDGMTYSCSILPMLSKTIGEKGNKFVFTLCDPPPQNESSCTRITSELRLITLGMDHSGVFEILTLMASLPI